MRLIDADELKKCAYRTYDDFGNDHKSVDVEDIDYMPTVEQPTGEWVRNPTNCKIVCSKCRQIALGEGVVVRRSNYCPHCGVKMLNAKAREEE